MQGKRYEEATNSFKGLKGWVDGLTLFRHDGGHWRLMRHFIFQQKVEATPRDGGKMEGQDCQVQAKYSMRSGLERPIRRFFRADPYPLPDNFPKVWTHNNALWRRE